MSENRSSFSGKIGFVLAAAGSAVGLGNIWRFPYLAAEYGGGIFLLVYLILAFAFGVILMSAEVAIGRKTGKSAIGAFGQLDKRYKFLGLMASAAPVIILPYYSVIGGWVTKYFGVFVTGGMQDAVAEGYFSDFIAQPFEPIVWFLVFIGLTALVVLLGVEKGIEKVSKFLMPVLVALTIGIAVYSMCLPGAMDGVKYYLTPDFSKFSVTTVLAAMGQLFYSMSIAMGIMITYGSYMKKNVSIESSSRQIALFDSGIAFLAGLMVIPAVFAFNPNAIGKGPGLMFVTLPQVFNSIGGVGGSIIGALFFLLVFLAAITSSISLMETVVSIFKDKFGWSRKTSCFVVLGICLALGLPSSLGHGVLGGISIGGMTILDMFDFFANSILMPIVALITCIFIGYVLKPKTVTDELAIGGKAKKYTYFNIIIKYVAPVFIVAILIFSVLEGLGVLKI